VTEAGLGRDTLRSLARLRDPIGILSIYVGASRERSSRRHSSLLLSVRNELRALRRRVRLERPRRHRVAFARRLVALECELPALFDRTETTRGGAFFALLATGRVHALAVPSPPTDLVVIAETPFLAPLVGALEAVRPAGIATASRSGVRVLEWRLGETDEVERFGFDEGGTGWREMKGPAAANPALLQQTAPQRDRYERRVDDRRQRFLASAGARLGVLAASRGWDRLLLAGDARLIHALFEAASDVHDFDPILVDRVLAGLSSHELADAVAPEFEADTGRRRRLLAGRVLDAALGSGRGALGPSEVLGALTEGRVRHLLIEEGRRFPGGSASDACLVPDGEVALGVPASDIGRQPDLTPLMIGRALETGAHVTLVDGGGRGLLASVGGVAALLRW
jgi:hypothetical protein